MNPAMSALSWFSIVIFTIPLAMLLLLSLSSGAVIQIAAHAILLVAGAALVLALRPRDL